VKPPAFTYHRPTDLGEALAVLAETGADGKVLAGGQSLVPVLNMRLAAPAHLVDINRLPGLASVRADGTAVRVGALVRHADLERDRAAARLLPLLGEATRHVAHPAIRNRGTTVGSLAHGDPAAEMPAVLALFGGHVELASLPGPDHARTAPKRAALLGVNSEPGSPMPGQPGTGEPSWGGSAVSGRTVPAAEFFVGPLETAIRPGELAVAAVFPVPAGRTGTAWLELSRRHGDYALCGIGALVTVDDDLRITTARVACCSVGPVPVVVDVTDAVAGRAGVSADWTAAGALAAGKVDPDGDIHATAAYRRHLVGVLTARALRTATDRAEGVD
jgi:carbon-monoxide dehydrogenase medium subunit